LNEFNFVEVDGEKIEKSLISHYERFTGDTLTVGDATRHILQGIAYALVIATNNINITGKGNLLRFSYGVALDALGELLGVTRLDEEPSTVTLKFTLSSAQATAVEIPQGTRATADGKIFFATDETLIIPSGSTDGTVTATATIKGEAGNGFIEGQISKLVDGVPYVGAVVNTTVSTDGREVETDDDFKERIRIAPFSFSTAGAEEAYRYLALSANPNVGDVDVFSYTAGQVIITVLKANGVVPESDDEVITDVLNACSAKTARPLTDDVKVYKAYGVPTTIEATYYISEEDSISATKIQADVEKAVNDYILWQTSKIGRDINPDQLRYKMYQAGAYVVDIKTPIAKRVDRGFVAQFTDVNVTYGGIKGLEESDTSAAAIWGE